MRVRVDVTRRPEIADPEGSTIQRALLDLGYTNISGVRVDRVIHLELEEVDPGTVTGQVEEMCRVLLTNPVLEGFEVVVTE